MSAEPLRGCPDCAVNVGEPHEDGCDVARCLATGAQRLSCDGYNWDNTNHDCGTDVWTGRWPGEAECEEYGWWCYFVPNVGFVPCAPDQPEAMHDLNRLAMACDWDVAAARWRRREEVQR